MTKTDKVDERWPIGLRLVWSDLSQLVRRGKEVEAKALLLQAVLLPIDRRTLKQYHQYKDGEGAEYVPTEDDIAREAAEIRAGWDAADIQSRRVRQYDDPVEHETHVWKSPSARRRKQIG